MIALVSKINVINAYNVYPNFCYTDMNVTVLKIHSNLEHTRLKQGMIIDRLFLELLFCCFLLPFCKVKYNTGRSIVSDKDELQVVHFDDRMRQNGVPAHLKGSKLMYSIQYHCMNLSVRTSTFFSTKKVLLASAILRKKFCK